MKIISSLLLAANNTKKKRRRRRIYTLPHLYLKTTFGLHKFANTGICSFLSVQPILSTILGIQKSVFSFNAHSRTKLESFQLCLSNPHPQDSYEAHIQSRIKLIEIMLVLFETPAGYSLFKVRETHGLIIMVPLKMSSTACQVSN